MISPNLQKQQSLHIRPKKSPPPGVVTPGGGFYSTLSCLIGQQLFRPSLRLASAVDDEPYDGYAGYYRQDYHYDGPDRESTFVLNDSGVGVAVASGAKWPWAEPRLP